MSAVLIIIDQSLSYRRYQNCLMCINRISRINNHLKVKGMHLGFVIDGGCDKSIFAEQNTVNHFVSRKSNVFKMTLDA